MTRSGRRLLSLWESRHLTWFTMRHAVPVAGTPSGILASNEYGVYCVPKSCRHRRAARAVLRSRVWEPETVNLVCRTCCEGDIVHGGSFFGDFLPAFAWSRVASARVWAFEPNLENYQCALQTIALNGLTNVLLTRAALHGASGNGLLATRSLNGRALGGASHLVAETTSAGYVEEVDLVTVDEQVPPNRKVSVIQLDIEGHEREALEGALATLRRCRPLLVLETVPDLDWVAANLGPLGYGPRGTVHGNAILAAD